MIPSRSIAIVHPNFHNLKRTEYFILDLCKEWVKKGHQVTLISTGFSSAIKQTLVSIGCKYKRLGLPFIKMDDDTPRNVKLLAHQLAFSLKGIDVVYVHTYPATLWVTYAMSIGYRLPPVVWACHEPPRHLYQIQVSDHFFQYDFNPFVSDDYYSSKPVVLAPETHQWVRKLDQSLSCFIPTIVANSRFTKQNIKDIYNVEAKMVHFGLPFLTPEITKFPNRKTQIGLLTHLEQEKNIPNCLKALSLLKKEGYLQWHFNIMGAGSQQSDLEQFVKTLELEEDVTFFGFIAEAALGDLISRQDFFVYTPFNEPLSLVPLEVAQCEKPCIVSNVGGSLETVIDQQTGLHVNPLDVNDIAKAIGVLMDDKTRCMQMGKAAQIFVHDQFSITKAADYLIDVIPWN